MQDIKNIIMSLHAETKSKSRYIDHFRFCAFYSIYLLVIFIIFFIIIFKISRPNTLRNKLWKSLHYCCMSMFYNRWLILSSFVSLVLFLKPYILAYPLISLSKVRQSALLTKPTNCQAALLMKRGLSGRAPSKNRHGAWKSERQTTPLTKELHRVHAHWLPASQRIPVIFDTIVLCFQGCASFIASTCRSEWIKTNCTK